MTKKTKQQPKKITRTDEQMRCQHAGCRRRSKGPRFKYLCEKHIDIKAEVKKQKRAGQRKVK